MNRNLYLVYQLNGGAFMAEIQIIGLTDVQVEKLTNGILNKGTLRNWRSQCKGPRFFRVGRKVIYRPQDIEDFLFSHPILTQDSRE